MEKPHADFLVNKPSQAHCQQQQKLPESYVNRSKIPAPRVQTILFETQNIKEQRTSQSLSAFLTYKNL